MLDLIILRQRNKVRRIKGKNLYMKKDISWIPQLAKDRHNYDAICALALTERTLLSFVLSYNNQNEKNNEKFRYLSSFFLTLFDIIKYLKIVDFW